MYEPLSRESEAYKRVYDLLEEHTFTWITDAWEKHPSVDAISVKRLSPPSPAQCSAIVEKHGVDPQSLAHACAHVKTQALVYVGDQCAAIPLEVADTIVAVLQAHA